MAIERSLTEALRTKRSEMRWSRVDGAGLDVLEVRSFESREWVFSWRGRVVVAPLDDGTGIGLSRDAVLVAEAGGAPIRVGSRGEVASCVIFEDAPKVGVRPTARIESPRLCRVVAPNVEELFRIAVAEMAKSPRNSLPIAPALARARRYIEEHLADDFDLDHLAAAAGMERCHLCRSFGRTFGLPPYRYRTHLRVAWARELLTSGVGCSEVASLVGFCDQSHLTRCFKELTGTTPRGYARTLARAPGGPISAKRPFLAA